MDGMEDLWVISVNVGDILQCRLPPEREENFMKWLYTLVNNCVKYTWIDERLSCYYDNEQLWEDMYALLSQEKEIEQTVKGLLR
jgi:hypothetical protein